jgi:peptidyl-prolyl cis-trans isomerase D
MAVIQKIRDKYAKVAGGVIALSLISFLLMDAGDNLKKIFTGSNYVVKVNGDKVDVKEYAQRINEYESLYELMGSKVDDNTRAQIHSQVLNEMITEKLVQRQQEKLGLGISPEEEKEMFSPVNPEPFVKQFPYFKNPQTNEFDPQALTQFEQKKLPNTPEAQKAMEQWTIFKNYIKRNKIVQKYNALFSGAITTPKFLVDRMTKDQFYHASISFVKVPFTSILDKDVTVTDDEITAYLKKHENQYKTQDPSRSMEYVAFDVTPSSVDTEKTLSALNMVKAEFESTTDAESFVNRNSEENFAGGYVTKKTFTNPFADSILNKPVGAIYGPYYENGFYKMTKVTDRKSLPDSVKVRHILVKTKDKGGEVLSDSAAKKRIDSVEAMVKSGASFDSLVQKYSDDQGSKATKGEYDFALAQRQNLSKEFADFAFEGKAGERKVVKVENDNYSGYHYIEIINQRNIDVASKLATISKSLYASEETRNMAYAKAQEFAGKNNTAKAFDETTKKESINKLQAQNVKPSDFQIPGVGTSREVIRWMYNAKVGDVSQVFSLDNRYIVGKLSNIQESGLPKINESNRTMYEGLVKAEKKSAKIIEKFKSSTTLEALAQASAQQIQNADSFSAGTTYFPAIGFEPKVVGYTFSENLKPGAMSQGIKGQDGVFYISVKNRVQNPVVNAEMNQNIQQQTMQMQQLRGSMAGSKQESNKRNADIDYNVENLY